ncbi:hypothetical protein [Azohydromonas caseinilytica]|uniref:Uncharacterized protein n=1 Tax=Azohydromonas caseinilytica TaxID=2728836 RepID=A0A848FF87_9BURK|nr:hypothetical protein [Azohydromonas caseinilytica]NML16989.1 hypothetical protein [Azohydromonas caseinilytica]
MNLSVSDQAGARAPSPSCRRSRDLPDPIHEAHLRLGEQIHRGELRGLPARAEAVLYEYLAKADLSRVDDGGRRRVFDTAVRELQEATDYCRRSITGANADLVAWGLIERPPQELHGARGPGTPIGKTWLTPYADAMFFGPRAQNVAQPVDKEPNPSGGEGVAPQAAEEAADTEAPRPPAPAGSRAVHVRDDLKPLLQVMQPDDVRKVLAVARAHDVWVQDVMAHRLPAILAAREPVGYLIHLIHSGEDWQRRVTPVGGHKEAAVQGSVKGPNTLASEREDRERERESAEHRAQWSKPRIEHLQAFSVLKSAAKLRGLQAAS